MPWKECSVMDERLQWVARRLAGEPPTLINSARRPVNHVGLACTASAWFRFPWPSVFLTRRSTVKSDSRYSFQFNERSGPARLKPAAFCLKGRCSIQLCYQQTREGSVMNRSPQGDWVRAPLGRWFPNLHYALTGSREG